VNSYVAGICVMSGYVNMSVLDLGPLITITLLTRGI